MLLNRKKATVGLQNAIAFLFPKFRLKLPGIIREIGDLDYCLIKYEAPYQDRSFPNKYTIGKDLDILVSRADFERLTGRLEGALEPCKWLRKKLLSRKHGILIRLEFLGVIHYQFDLCYQVDRLGEGFVEEVVERRERVGKLLVAKRGDEV